MASRTLYVLMRLIKLVHIHSKALEKRGYLADYTENYDAYGINLDFMFIQITY
jgi:hypothetical protein